MKLQALTFVALAVAGFSLNAQDIKFGVNNPDLKLQFGGQLTLALPQGDIAKKEFLDGKLGYGLGLHLLIPLGGSHAIVTRLDYILYKKPSTILTVEELRSLGFYAPEGEGHDDASVDGRLDMVTVGADYHYYFDGKVGEGFYLLGGLGVCSSRAKQVVKWGGPAVSDTAQGSRDTTSTIALQGGLGYMFTSHVGAELRYTHTSFDMFSSSSKTAPAINFSIVGRF